MQLPEFEGLVEQLLSADNASRKQAEDVYEQLKTHPDGVLELLLRCLRQSPHVQNRQFCAIMLRKVRRRRRDEEGISRRRRHHDTTAM